MTTHSQRRRRFGHLLVAGLFLFQQMAFAASITVDRFDSTVADDGQCSLREAITAANTDTASGATPGECPAGSGTDTITLTGDVTLTAVDNTTDGANGLPSITGEVTIEGVGGSPLRAIVRDLAAPDFRIFHVGSSGSLGLQNVEVRNGSSVGSPNGFGGGIRNLGVLTLTDSTLSGNSADIFGGGIYARDSTVTLTHSTVSGNLGKAGGGGIFSTGGGIVTLTSSTVSGNSTSNLFVRGGGIYNGPYSIVSLTNSTVSGNSAFFGGAIYNSGGTATLTNSTVSGNGAYSGGGIYTRGGTVTLTHSTVSANSASFGGDDFYAFGIVSLTGSLVGYDCGVGTQVIDGGGNLAVNTSCGTIPDTLTGLDPVLADNGGPTLTHRLLAGSNAIDNAGTCGLATDQRGASRSDGVCDSGSYEFRVCTLPGGNDLVLSNDTILITQTFEACQTITAGPNWQVAAGGDVTLRAGSAVILADGFSVTSGGKLTVEIDGNLQLITTAHQPQ